MFELSTHIIIRTPINSLTEAYKEITSSSLEESIYISSSEFWNRFKIEKHAKTPKKLFGMHLTYEKYKIRSCTRPTPFASFAGSSAISINDEDTNLVIESPEQHKRALRLDMNYLYQIIRKIEKDQKIKKQLTLHLNSSLYKTKEHIRYVEYEIRKGHRNYGLISLEKTEILDQLIDLIGEKNYSYSKIVELIALWANVSEQEAKDYLDSLLDSQVLITNLEPSITVVDPLEQLIKKLDKLEHSKNYHTFLMKVHKDISSPKLGVDFYAKLIEELKSVFPSESKNLLQVDLSLNFAKKNIHRRPLERITAQLQELSAFSISAESPKLKDFKQSFSERYGATSVPLSQALDSDIGIGYATQKTAKLSENSDPIITHLQSLAVEKYNDYLVNGLDKIEITQDLFKSKKTSEDGQPNPLPFSMYALGSILSSESEEKENNLMFNLRGFGGPSSANLLARFSNGDQEIRTVIDQELEAETVKYENAILAEIVHLPEARVGNVILRPPLREYEIPYLGNSGLESKNQLEINDLLISMRGGKVILWSKKLKKRVIPRLSSAHNFRSNALPIYQFLCDLQKQDVFLPFLWNWGVLNQLNYLPRVEYKNIILSRARWKIKLEDIVEKKSKSKYKESDLLLIKEYRKKLMIPDRVLYCEGDNQLLIDFNSQYGPELFLNYLIKDGEVTIEEFLFKEENCIVKDANGKAYTNEVIIPLRNPNAKNISLLESKSIVTPDRFNGIQREFLPYSEWLYFKIYCGTATAENLLRNVLYPFLKKAIPDKKFEKFFFIRYKDSLDHIRIRFFNAKKEKNQPLLGEICSLLEPWLNSGEISNLTLDTYVRELERYSPKEIVLAENIFFQDSICTLRLIKLLGEVENSARYKDLLALRGIDILLNDFDLNILDKYEVANTLRQNYFNEFNGDKSMLQLLNGNYKGRRKDIFNHMNSDLDKENGIEEAIVFFQQRSIGSQEEIKKLRSNLEKEVIMRIIPSYIHMFINRLFTTNQRRKELSLYFFLERYYYSQKVIQKVK